MLLRSFNMEEIEKEKQIVKKIAQKITEENGGSADIEIKEQYLNMKEKMEENPKVLERLKKAYDFYWWS